MEIILTGFVLLLAVVISGTLARAIPVPIPLPLIQIGVGMAIASMASFRVVLEPDIFMLLLLPPLLFLDAWRIPKDGLLRDKTTILGLAFGLVLFTVVVAGFFIHWLIPAMPLSVAFALAAIVSPTDPVAVSAIAARVSVPERLLRILEGESLFNDASGLVCMRFAVAATLTGVFAWQEAWKTFTWLVIGGVGIGAGLTWSVSLISGWLARRYGEESGAHIIINLLTPFAAYLAAEHFHASGILAAVSAGIAVSYAEQAGKTPAATRLQRNAVWKAVQFAITGITFVLLGEQLPSIVYGAAKVVSQTNHNNPAWLMVYVVAISLVLAILRFVWVWLTLRFSLFRARHRGQAQQYPGWKLIAATSLGGVRGAVTLVGILTLPMTLTDGSPFPARDLAIFLAAGAIIVSLVAAAIGLPFLLKDLKLPVEPTHKLMEDRARAKAANAAIEAIERQQHKLLQSDAKDINLYAAVVTRVTEPYRHRLDGYQKTGEDALTIQKSDTLEKEFRVIGLKAARDEIYRLARTGQLSDDTARAIVSEFDLVEARLKA